MVSELLVIDASTSAKMHSVFWSDVLRNAGHNMQTMPIGGVTRSPSPCGAIFMPRGASSEQLLAAASPEDVSDLEFLFEESRDEFFADFESLRVKISEMIQCLLDWLEKRFDRYECITIEGI